MRDCKHGQLARSCNICEMEQEIERLRAELALAIDDCRAAQVERDNVRAAYITQIDRLRAELAECKQGAERYRWIRDNGDGVEITVREVNEDGGEEWIAGYYGPELDIAIDTARKGEGEK